MDVHGPACVVAPALAVDRERVRARRPMDRHPVAGSPPRARERAIAAVVEAGALVVVLLVVGAREVADARDVLRRGAAQQPQQRGVTSLPSASNARRKAFAQLVFQACSSRVPVMLLAVVVLS